MSLHCSGILAQLMFRPSHGPVSKVVHVHGSVWPATEVDAF